MIRVFSFDYDAITWRSIQLYNDLVGGDANPTELWDFIERERHTEDFYTIDWSIIHNVIDVIKNSPNAKIIPIVSHDKIVDYLKDEKDLFIINLDQHHDLMYHEEDYSNIVDFNEWTIANWAGYFLLKDKCFENTYTWVKTPTSQPFSLWKENGIQEKNVNIWNLSQFDDNVKNGLGNFDYIFLCLSPQWVPYPSREPYNLLCKIYCEEPPKIDYTLLNNKDDGKIIEIETTKEGE